MDISTVLMYAVMFGRQLAERTSTKIDDELIDLLEAIRTDPWLLEWLSGKSDQPSGTLSIEVAPEGDLKLAIERKEIQWGTLADRLPEILALIQLIRSFLK